MRGSSCAVMGWRNLWRNRRRTLLTLSSIAFGALFALIFTGIGDASWKAMIDYAARMGGGHVCLQHPEYLDTPSPSKTVGGIDALKRVALAQGDVKRVVSRISGQLMLSTARQSYAAFFVAFDPASETTETFPFLHSVVEGRMFASSRQGGIILGRRLAENLDAKMGSKVVYTLTDRNGEIVTALARVSGIIETGSQGLDGKLCLLPIDTMREVLHYRGDEATRVALFLGHHRRIRAVLPQLLERIPKDVAVLEWRDVNPELAGFISMKVNGTILMEIVILIVIAAGIFNTLFVGVMERMREFGILMAIGFSPARLFRMVLWESLWLGLAGLAIGAAITAIPYYLLSTRGLDFRAMMGNQSGDVAGVVFTPVIHANIYPENAFFIGAAILVATLLSGLYPAWRAGRVVPVEAIKLV